MPPTPAPANTSPKTVIRLAVDAPDDETLAQLGRVWQACFELRRAVQRDARAKVKAFWTAKHERDRDGYDAVRKRLGLDERAFQKLATAHLHGAGAQLRRGVTHQMAQEIGASVWRGAQNSLFRRHGLPRTDRWFDFTSIPGRAKVPSATNQWNTFRLHGTLEGHRATFGCDGRFAQPSRMPRPDRPARNSWWNHDGALVIVLRDPDGSGRDIVLPVRLPSAPSAQAHLEHFLSDPDRWQSIKLVRTQDPTVRGGWRYEAHLLVRVGPYASAAVQAGRRAAPQGRRAGVDLNVSNLSVASVDHAGSGLRLSRVDRTADRRAAEQARARKDRGRQRALDRSRRNQNPDQYEPSKAQQVEARRREADGLAPRQHVPQGPRKANVLDVPKQAYRRDQTSATYRRTRAQMVADGAARTRASKDLARQIARDIIAEHGTVIAAEAGNVSAWARQWGRGVAAFTPGRLLEVLATEAAAAGGELTRIKTRTTACSQHCLCGHRAKKGLGDRVHTCTACGLTGDRDAVAAVLIAHVNHTTDDHHIDFVATRALCAEPATWETLEATLRTTSNTQGQQDALSASTHTGPRDAQCVNGSNGSPTTVGSARRTVRNAPNATPQQTHSGGTSADRFGSTPDLTRPSRRERVTR